MGFLSCHICHKILGINRKWYTAHHAKCSRNITLPGDQDSTWLRTACPWSYSANISQIHLCHLIYIDYYQLNICQSLLTWLRLGWCLPQILQLTCVNLQYCGNNTNEHSILQLQFLKKIVNRIRTECKHISQLNLKNSETESEQISLHTNEIKRRKQNSMYSCLHLPGSSSHPAIHLLGSFCGSCHQCLFFFSKVPHHYTLAWNWIIDTSIF